MPQGLSIIDDLQGLLPPALKWGLTGGGAAAGWHYGQGTAIPLSYVIGGAAAGFCLVACLFAGLRLVRLLAVAGIALLVVNYALLIPYGYGDHVPGWAATTKAALRSLDPLPLAQQWGKSVEVRPEGR